MEPKSTVADPYRIIPDSSPQGIAAARHIMIREAAYYRAKERGFAPGHELDDWLHAERQIDALLAAAGRV